jgi:CheY-like chemotaxis protein
MLKRRIENGRIEEMPHFVDTALGSATRAANLTHRLLAFARRQSLDPKPVDTNRLILSLADLFRQTFGEGIEMVFELAPALPPAFCDASQLETALLDLAANARDALGVAGRFTIETLAAKTPAGDGQLVIRIGDTGSGMPPEAVTRAFEPFFTTKPTGRGTGLGLSTVHGFVMQSGGHVTIDSTPGIGTLVTLHLPCADTPEPAAVVPAAIPEPIATAGRELLVVEDDPAVRQLIVELLMALGHGVTAVEDGTAAVPILTDVGHAIDLLITDVGLPGLNGRQVAEIGRQHRPELPVLFVTGYAHQARMRGDFLGAGMEMVTKPFALDALLTKVSAMLARG